MFRTILIDPPWPQGKTGKRAARPNQGVRLDYPTLTLPKIEAMRVADLAANDALLFLWATDRYLEAAHGIMRSWGFKKHCVFVWNKNTGVCPFSVQFRNEFMLMGYRGKLSLKKIGVPTNFSARVTRHSEKPLESYRIIEQIAYEPRVELFARRRLPGWSAWGNEVDSDVTIPGEV